MIVAPLTPSHAPLAQQDQQYYYPLYPTITHYPHTYNFMPSSSSDCFDADLQHGGKRVKVEQQHQEHYQQNQPLLSYFPDNTLDYSSFNTAAGLSQSHLHAPQINLDKASEQPGSPLTVTTTLSQYSTPSRSPTRVSIHSDTAHSDWALFDDSMAGTLTHDIPKDRNTNSLHSNQLQQTSVTTPSSTASTTAQAHMRSAFPYQMNSAALNGQYYAGFPIPDFTKLSQHPVLNPYGPPPYSNHQQAQNNNLHQQHEEDLPALSPSTRYQPSSNQSAREELRSPMTPLGSPVSNDGDRAQNARTSAPHLHNPLPKFTRTVSDAVEDELFRSSPLDAPKSQTSHKHQIKTPISPTLATYFQQAQKDHVLDSTRNNTQHGLVSREKSPFRANSPFHPTRTPQGVQVTPVRRSVINYITAQGKREQQQELDMQSINQHMMMNEEADRLASTPKTISPKDALLDYPEPEDEASKLSLFPHEQNTTQFGSNTNSQTQSHNHTHFQSTDMGDGNDSEISYPSGSRRGSEAESISSIGAFSYHHSPLMQQNLPFPFQTLGSSTEAGSSSLPDKSSTSHSPTLSKPEGSRADSGAYTCTAPGCQQRFQTPAKLQKHKRENHRQSSPAGPSGMTSTLQGGVNRLQGPHRCARINPTTGKPCNTIFSRPYDLTRHDDTIHNTSREKVRCEICNDEKTFSRQDALTRHKKVKHGIDK